MFGLSYLPEWLLEFLGRADCIALKAREAALAGDHQEAARLRAEFERTHDTVLSELDRQSFARKTSSQREPGHHE